MPLADRAAQFAPFAALSGHDAAIRETARLTDQEIDLGEDQMALLNEKLRVLIDCIDQHPEVSITYFVPDLRKTGGAYVTVKGRFQKIDEFTRAIVLDDQTIAIDSILQLDIPAQ
jgi:hypothetical protein